MRLAAMLLMACSLTLSGCKNDVERPNSTFCLNNVPGLKRTCYNLKTDFDDNGNLLADAKPLVKTYKDEAAMLADLNKNQCADPQSWAALKAYVRALRDAN